MKNTLLHIHHEYVSGHSVLDHLALFAEVQSQAHVLQQALVNADQVCAAMETVLASDFPMSDADRAARTRNTQALRAALTLLEY